MGINMLDMKQSNAQTVLWKLYDRKTATVKELAQETGLSFATVANMLNRFVESGQVILGEMLAATGGRPSQAYTFHAGHAHLLVLSARTKNETNLVSAFVGDLYGKTVWQMQQPFADIRLESFAYMADIALRSFPTIKVLAFSLPGVEHNGVFLNSDYPMLQGVSFSGHFQSRYALPVVAENDINAAALGAAQTLSSAEGLVGIYLPRYFPPGAAVIVDGRILKGFCGYAGEVKLLPLGIDWLALEYHNPVKAATAVASLISVFSATVNPRHLVLYGDFFTAAFRQELQRQLSRQATGEILPALAYQSNLDKDVVSGLMAQSIAAYRCALGAPLSSHRQNNL